MLFDIELIKNVYKFYNAFFLTVFLLRLFNFQLSVGPIQKNMLLRKPLSGIKICQIQDG